MRRLKNFTAQAASRKRSLSQQSLNHGRPPTTDGLKVGKGVKNYDRIRPNLELFLQNHFAVVERIEVIQEHDQRKPLFRSTVEKREITTTSANYETKVTEVSFSESVGCKRRKQEKIPCRCTKKLKLKI